MSAGFAEARATRATRRAPLLAAMTGLEERGVSCASCKGTCCTFVANSMQITPLEAVDLYLHLDDTREFTAALTARLDEAVARFALDRPAAGDGRRAFSRRRYTCPFFGAKALGCPLPRAAKPYGCLAFNARSAGVGDGEDCASDTATLAGRESAPEDALNAALKAELGLGWDKESIPVALLALRARLG